MLTNSISLLHAAVSVEAYVLANWDDLGKQKKNFTGCYCLKENRWI